MFDDQSRMYKNQFVPLDAINVDLYKEYVGDDVIEELKWLARPLKHKVWANVNSTFVGGGVAEMLRSVVAFAKGLDINCRWFVIEGTEDFFGVTKKFHNLLQGYKEDIDMTEIFHAYLETIQQNVESTKVTAHMIVVHDPQPAAAIMYGNMHGHILWRCHIDTSEPSRRIWRFLLPYLNHYDGAIFTHSSYIQQGLQVPTYIITPAIDPLKPKNKHRSRQDALDTVAPLLKKHNIDPNRPMVLAISRYDIHKNQKTIIQAFKMLKQDSTMQKRNPMLVLVGNCATDDPEGEKMYDTIIKEIAGDENIYPLLNIENNDENIGSLMKLGDCFVHISSKEGFGLVVSEAMWQGTPVIGSNIGGITQQIISGNTGFLVEPQDTEQVCRYMKFFLENKLERDIMGQNATEHVRNNFLIPALVKKYLLLMRYYLEIDNKFPDFRVNDITYNEIKEAVFGRSIWPISTKHLKDTIETIWEELESPKSADKR